jgi:hypothetical protein
MATKFYVILAYANWCGHKHDSVHLAAKCARKHDRDANGVKQQWAVWGTDGCNIPYQHSEGYTTTGAGLDSIPDL